MRYTTVNPDGSTTFWYSHSTANQVLLAGEFSGWQPWGMMRTDDGWWVNTVPLSQGNYSYKFIVDGRWVNDQFNYKWDYYGNSRIPVGTGEGALVHHYFYTPALGCTKGYVIYLPPSYPYRPKTRYPVLYLLHGILDDETTWVNKGRVHEAMDHLINRREIGEFIVVLPDGDTSDYRNGKEGRYEDYIIYDLIPHIDSEYRTIQNGKYRAIDGISLGGGGAIRFGAIYPHLFGSIGSLSGAFDEEIFYVVERGAEEMIKRGIRVRLSCGDKEPGAIESARQMALHFQSLGIDYEHYQNEGIHDWPLWVNDIYGSLMFHWWNFKR